MKYTKVCEQCGITYESKRSDSKFHTSNCKLTFNRIKAKAVSSTTNQLTDTVKSETSEPKAAWQKVMDGEESGVDIGYGPDDYTRGMVEERVKRGDAFKPNWYNHEAGFKSKNHAISILYTSRK